MQTIPASGPAAILRSAADARRAPGFGCGCPTAPSRQSVKGLPMAAEKKDAKPISELEYEQCRDELIEVVRVLEQGGLSLEESLTLWERGEKLAKRCEEHLAGARKRIEDVLGSGDAEGT
ncbi:exodeoxyribonuclease VII, small subunit [Mycobacterium xenopi 3993]|nr:exodeoxyribonuclease VII, small subunit [Mycobacterium xenopi 3993]